MLQMLSWLLSPFCQVYQQECLLLDRANRWKFLHCCYQRFLTHLETLRDFWLCWSSRTHFFIPGKAPNLNWKHHGYICVPCLHPRIFLRSELSYRPSTCCIRDKLHRLLVVHEYLHNHSFVPTSLSVCWRGYLQSNEHWSIRRLQPSTRNGRNR